MRERSVAETTVVVGEALEGPAVDRWRRLITDAAALRPHQLVIDLRNAPSIDAAAIVLLLQIHRQMVCADGRLILRAPTARVRTMLRLARVDQVLEVEDGKRSTATAANG